MKTLLLDCKDARPSVTAHGAPSGLAEAHRATSFDGARGAPSRLTGVQRAIGVAGAHGAPSGLGGAHGAIDFAGSHGAPTGLAGALEVQVSLMRTALPGRPKPIQL